MANSNQAASSKKMAKILAAAAAAWRKMRASWQQKSVAVSKHGGNAKRGGISKAAAWQQHQHRISEISGESAIINM